MTVSGRAVLVDWWRTANADTLVALCLVSSAWGYLVWRYGGVSESDWALALPPIVVGAALASRARAHGVPSCCTQPMFWLVTYIALQVLPLPISLLWLVSPARAELTEALATVGIGAGWAPLSVQAAATIARFTQAVGAICVFLVIRNVTRARAWRAAYVLIAVATLEAGWGLAQIVEAPDEPVTGTYVNRNHFAGMMTMVLPFAAGLAWRGLTDALGYGDMRYRRTAGVALVSSGVLVAGVLYSLSRTAIAAAAGSLATLSFSAATPRRRVRWLVAFALGAITLLLYLSPEPFVRRLSDATTPGAGLDVRVSIWRDTLPLLATYPLFGCGLGAYESALYRFQRTSPMQRYDYAHNDYLQVLAELGLVGVALVAWTAAALLRSILRNTRLADPNRRLLAQASLGGLAALAVYSLTDFNLYIPANALVAAWVSGLGEGAAGARAE